MFVNQAAGVVPTSGDVLGVPKFCHHFSFWLPEHDKLMTMTTGLTTSRYMIPTNYTYRNADIHMQSDTDSVIYVPRGSDASVPRSFIVHTKFSRRGIGK